MEHSLFSRAAEPTEHAATLCVPMELCPWCQRWHPGAGRAGGRGGQLSLYSPVWTVGLELLCPAWWVFWLLFLGEVCKRSQKINLLTGDLGTARSECFVLTT